MATHDRDTEGVNDAQTFDRARVEYTGQRLVDALAESLLADLAFDTTAVAVSVRDVKL